MNDNRQQFENSIMKLTYDKEISVEDMQKIMDANEKLVKEMKDGTNTVSR